MKNMKKQMGYYDEKKPSVVWLILLPFIFIGSIFYIILGIANIFNGKLYFGVAFALFSAGSIPAWFKKFNKYKKAKTKRDNAFKYGKKFKGKIIKTEMSTCNITSGVFKKGKIDYEYYAFVEFSNDKGEKNVFTTSRLNYNPEFIDTKDVTVYAYDNIFYATDFGCIKETYVRPEKNWERFS